MKKSAYSFKELNKELNLNMNLLLGDIEYFENICCTSKEFFLFKRIYFIFREYERILNIWNTLNTSFKDDQIYSSYYNNKVIPIINESAQEMITYYDCHSEEILSKLGIIQRSKLEVVSRLCSNGWSGNILVMGREDQIVKICKTIVDYYNDTFENRGNLTNFWMSDEVHKFCFSSEYAGPAKILNPKYEDFMIIDLK